MVKSWQHLHIREALWNRPLEFLVWVYLVVMLLTSLLTCSSCGRKIQPTRYTCPATTRMSSDRPRPPSSSSNSCTGPDLSVLTRSTLSWPPTTESSTPSFNFRWRRTTAAWRRGRRETRLPTPPPPPGRKLTRLFLKRLGHFWKG